VRRALLLRSLLKAKDTDTLEIDRDLLNALLREPRYRYGARSMEKTVQPLMVPHAPLRAAQLPPPQVLAQHLDTCEVFQSLIAENAAFLTTENIHALAAAIHENYQIRTDPSYVYDPQFREKFDNLDAWGKATNFAAARGIPHVLAVAGLCVMPGRATDQEAALIKERLERYIDPLRREEHERWMAYLLANGWLQHPDKDPNTNKPLREKEKLLHNCLVPFDELDEQDKKKDDDSILSLPETVALIDFRIDFFPDLTI
jgi:hypothetical protein